MSTEEDDRTPAMDASSASHGQRVPHLVALTGPGVGTVYRLTKPEMIVGREGEIRLSHPGVSRRHARLLVTEEHVTVDDLGSTNGTFVGVERVKAPTVVNDGDAVAFGANTICRLTYISAGDAVPIHAEPGPGSTRIGTREFLLDLLHAEYAYARRHGSPLTLVFFRSDAATSFSDSNSGAVLSEESLSRIATTIDVTIRTEDLLARSADDEFVVLVRGDADAAARMAERVRARIDAHTEFPERAATWQTITAAVLPISPVTGAPGPRALPASQEILAAARAAARWAMSGNPNRIVRLKTLVV